jgi:hypothetical protein
VRRERRDLRIGLDLQNDRTLRDQGLVPRRPQLLGIVDVDALKPNHLDLAPTITLPHLDEAQTRALRLADNKIALNAGWDVDLLKLERKELADLEIGFDLSVTGFSTGEIDMLAPSRVPRLFVSLALQLEARAFVWWS